jgi:hypothetical protein
LEKFGGGYFLSSLMISCGFVVAICVVVVNFPQQTVEKCILWAPHQLAGTVFWKLLCVSVSFNFARQVKELRRKEGRGECSSLFYLEQFSLWCSLPFSSYKIILSHNITTGTKLELPYHGTKNCQKARSKKSTLLSESTVHWNICEIFIYTWDFEYLHTICVSTWMSESRNLNSSIS